MYEAQYFEQEHRCHLSLGARNPDLREIGGSVLLCFFAAIDSFGDGKAKSGLKIFVTQKLTAWQLF